MHAHWSFRLRYNHISVHPNCDCGSGGNPPTMRLAVEFPALVTCQCVLGHRHLTLSWMLKFDPYCCYLLFWWAFFYCLLCVMRSCSSWWINHSHIHNKQRQVTINDRKLNMINDMLCVFATVLKRHFTPPFIKFVCKVTAWVHLFEDSTQNVVLIRPCTDCCTYAKQSALCVALPKWLADIDCAFISLLLCCFWLLKQYPCYCRAQVQFALKHTNIEIVF